MITQKWIVCSERLPGEPWAGKIQVRYPNGRVIERDCLIFSKGQFSWQDGTADGRTGRMIYDNGGPGEVIAWLGLLEI